ncbi:hypothetical protein OQZ33_15845 [Pedobacter sp. MC2016-05]|uniref:hypothetical protein n=1 Tax=Pedobacter sp. MC2016-05 TaxID=2994474 RepID=UPI0022485BC0|nr:hypothetical protein [Pedobacter sp. MC2016-05]MCX2475806.1 hypothetical protein [Pedobacter sp. MC2016-05]
MTFYQLLKRFFSLILLICIFTCCKKKEDQPQPELNMPAVVTGNLYGSPFTAKVTIERYTKFSMNNYRSEDLFSIYLAGDGSKTCSSPLSEFSIRLTVPKKTGTFSGNDTYILVNDPGDPSGQNGALFSSEQTIITISSITGDKVSGQVNVKWAEQNIDFKGRFEASYCK